MTRLNDVLLDLKQCGLAMRPALAVAYGALGFWQAVEQVWPKIRGQQMPEPADRIMEGKNVHRLEDASSKKSTAF